MKAAWILFGIIIGIAFYPIASEAIEYYGKFPPTAAWTTISVNDTQNPNSTMIPFSYSAPLYFASDGSINITITNGSGGPAFLPP